MLIAKIEYMGKAGYNRREQVRSVKGLQYSICKLRLMSFVQEMAQRPLPVTGAERCLSFDKHKLRWYHGFSRPFDDRTFFIAQSEKTCYIPSIDCIYLQNTGHA